MNRGVSERLLVVAGRNIELALDDCRVKLSNPERSFWIERALGPAINRQKDNGYDIKLALQDLLDSATTQDETERPNVVLQSVNDLGMYTQSPDFS